MIISKWERPESIEQIVDLAYEGIWTLDADGLTDYINERGAAIIGYRPEEIIGRPPKDFMFPGDYDDKFFEDVRKKKVSRLERRLRHKDGSAVWTLGSAQPMFDEGGRYQGGLAMFDDITERKRAEEKLKESEQRFRALVTASSDFIYRVSPDWSEVYQYREQEYAPGTDRRIALWTERYIRPEDRLAFLAAVDRGIREKSVFEMEHWIRDDDGSLHWIFTRAVPMLDANGEISEWFGMAKDISEWKAAEQALRKSEQRFELLSEANSILLSSREPERVIQSIAGKVVRHLGCDVFFNYIFDELQGKLHLNAYCGVSKYAAKEVEWLEPGSAICGRVACDGKRIVSEDVQNNGDNSACLVRSLGIQAYACHPIKVGERTVGTLSFGARDRTRFEDDELALMQIVAEQVSVSIKRRRAELAARDREMHLARAQRIAHMGSWEWDVTNDRIYFSDEAYRIAGATPNRSAVRNADALALVHPEDRDLVASKMNYALDDGAYDIEYRIIRKDGEVRFIRDIGEVAVGGRGAPTKIVGIIQDITERKLVDEELKEREQQLAMAQHIAHMGSWTWDIQKDVFHPSDEAYIIFGMRPGEIVLSYADFLSFVHPEDRQRVLQQAALTDRQDAYEIEYRIIRKDGEERYIYSQGTVAYGKNGEPLKAMGTVQDITERMLMIKKLRENMMNLTLAQQVAHIGSWTLDIHSDIFHPSNEALRIFGLKSLGHSIKYADFLSFVHPGDRDRVKQQAALTDRKDIYGIDYRIVRPGGEERWIHSQGIFTYDHDKGSIKAVGTVQDITERKLTEIALKESQRRYQALIETNVDFIWEMDPQGRYTYCSPQMERLWGLKPEDMLGRTPFDMMPPEMRGEMLEQFIKRATEPAGFRGLSSTAYDANGDIVYLETSGVPFFGDDGTLLGYRGITRDVTEQVRKRAL